MRLLVHTGHFVEGEGRYRLQPPVGRFLLKDRSFVTCMNHPNLVEPWRHMSAWFQTCENDVVVEQLPLPPFALAHGGKKLYEEAFEGLSSLVDVNGSTGTTAKVIAEAFPRIHCTVFDVPHVVAAAEETHHSSNLSYVAGDMLTDDIPQADALLFKKSGVCPP
ncbi:unnamed protein product [Linum tenue]|uniref:O-methyltransferase C-terminal domain-containing protein n=1 Tax=Linum tenue TaxID=586396 RepID=A0AAV0GSJ2_9ROSI|nr:unnamed protein product [Linum tenue]